MSLILASASPRRRELLTMLGLDFKVIPAVGEEIQAEGRAPGETVCAISRAKAEEIEKKSVSGDMIIAADTVVYLDGEILGKPRDKEDAFRMLKRLSGRAHEVYTGVTVLADGGRTSEYERTLVYFRELSDREIHAYIATGEPMDKAGAYGAQGLGSLLVERIDGDFFNVMGLPLCRLSKILSGMGVELI